MIASKIESKKERRRDPRVTFRAIARLKFTDGRVFDNCQTSDVSVSGVFVEGVTGVETWDNCAVDFQLVGRSSSLVLTLNGQVVRVQPEGVALQFDDVDEDSFRHLENIVYYNYRQEGRLGVASFELPTEVDDESLYLSQPIGTRKPPVRSDFLGADNDEEDDDYSDYGEEIDREIIDRIGSRDDEDDY